MTRLRTVVVVSSAVALVAAGALAATFASSIGDDASANGSVAVGGMGDLAGSWVLVNHTSAPASVVGMVTMRFEADRLSVETGCNTARGTVAVENSVLVADALMTTRMACEPALMEQERWLVEMLTSRPRLERSGPALAMHWGEGERWWVGFEQEGPGALPVS